MSRYDYPLGDGHILVVGYDRPLANVFAQLTKDATDDDHDDDTHCGACGVVDAVGFPHDQLATISEVMPAVAAMLTTHGRRQLTVAEVEEIVQRLMDDGARP